MEQTLSKSQESTLSKKDITQILKFVIKYGEARYSNINIEKFIENIIKHYIYKTCFVVYDENNEIEAVARWNIYPSGKVAKILDVIIRPDKRNGALMQKMFCKGLMMFPMVKYIIWERFPNREIRFSSVEKLLRRL